MHRKIVLNTENKQDCLLPASRSSSIGPEGRFSFFHPKVKVKERISLRSTSFWYLRKQGERGTRCHLTEMEMEVI